MSKNYTKAYSKTSDRENSIFLGDVPKFDDGCTGIRTKRLGRGVPSLEDSVSLSEGLILFQDPSESIAKKDDVSYVSAFLSVLTPFEQEVVKWVYGLEGRDSISPRQIAVKYGKGRTERQVRDAHLKAIKKLKSYYFQEFFLANRKYP